MTRWILPLWLAAAVVLGPAVRAKAQTPTQPKPQSPPPTTQAQKCPGQDVATHQTSDAFSSITDGQPTPPGRPQITAIPFYDFGEEEFRRQFTIAVVLVKSGFWCQAQFGLSAPTLMVGDTLMDFERSATLSWQQRWHTDTGRLPTFSTLVAIQQPYGEPDEQTDLLLTGIIVKSTSWGAGYLDVIAETSGGIGFDNFQYRAVVGVKRIIKSGVAVFADLVVQEADAFALEFSLERDFKKGWTLGPGVSLSRSGPGSDWPDVSVGISLVKTFGSWGLRRR